MAKIDVDEYIEHSGMRKARFGGYEPDDVRQAMRALCAEYEQQLAASASETRTARTENEALRRRCQTLLGQNQSLTAQNATLAAQADKLAQRRGDIETRYTKVQERNHSLSDQVAVLRLKNSDLTREKKELEERAANADAALRIKGRAHDEARQKLTAERAQVLDEAYHEADEIRKKAEQDAASACAEAELKAKAIERLAREQATEQARTMVRAATDESREIQNAHRLRLQDLQSRITAMEQQRDRLADYFTQMIGELQEAQDYARQNSPVVLPEETALAEQPAEPQLDLSDEAVAAVTDQLRAEAAEEAETRSLVPDYPLPDAPADSAADTDADTLAPPVRPAEAPASPAAPKPDSQRPLEVPGAIFSYPIVRQPDEPILDDEPPASGPRAPIMPDLTDDPDDADAEEPEAPEAAAAPEALAPAAKPDPRRKRVLAALRSLNRKMERL